MPHDAPVWLYTSSRSGTTTEKDAAMQSIAKSMKRGLATLVGAGAVAFSLGTAAAAADGLRDCAVGSPPRQTLEAALDNLLAQAVDPASDLATLGMQAPGAVLLVQTPDWIYFKSAGVSDLETGAPLDCRSPYEIGSATKMMTGTVLLQLQEEGKVSLDDHLADHLPEIAARLPFGNEITLRQLATHTSGLFSYTDDAPDGTPGIMEGGLWDPTILTSGRTPEDLIEFVIAHGEPNFEPGAEGEWSYSNTGYVLLGMIIEKIAGMPLADVFQDRIFAPSGMRQTFLWNEVPKAEFGLPRAWFKTPFDIETTQWNLSQGWAAGGVISTATDMTLFIQTLAAGELFEKPDTLTTMLDGVPAEFPNLVYGIGLIQKPDDFFGHGGQTLGFESDIGFAPASGTTIVFWTNSANSIAAVGVPTIVGAMGGE